MSRGDLLDELNNKGGEELICYCPESNKEFVRHRFIRNGAMVEAIRKIDSSNGGRDQFLKKLRAETIAEIDRSKP